MCASSKLLLEIQRWKMMVNCTQRVGKDVHEPRQQKKEEYCLDVGHWQRVWYGSPHPGSHSHKLVCANKKGWPHLPECSWAQKYWGLVKFPSSPKTLAVHNFRIMKN